MKHTKTLLTLTLLFFALLGFTQKKGQMSFTSSSKEVPVLLRQAIDYFFEANVAAGNKLVTEAKEKDAASPMVYVLSFGGTDQYLKNLNKALESNPSADEKNFIMGIMEAQKDADNSKYFDPLIKKYSKDYQMLLMMGFYTTDDNRAIEIMEKSLKAKKNFGPAYNLLGYRYMAIKNMEKAKMNFDKYISLEPDNANVYDSKGDYFEANGQLKEAKESFEKAAEMGMAVSANKARFISVIEKNPELSAEDIKAINELVLENGNAVKAKDRESYANTIHDQGIRIVGNKTSRIGKSNFMVSVDNFFKGGEEYETLDRKIHQTFGLGPMAFAVGTEKTTYKPANGEKREREFSFVFLLEKNENGDWKILTDYFFDHNEWITQNNNNIEKTFYDWARLIGTSKTEWNDETLSKFDHFYSPQAIEIFWDGLSNIGYPNIRARLESFKGIKGKQGAFKPLKTFSSGDVGVSTSLFIQDMYSKSDKLYEYTFPLMTIFVKENEEWKVLVMHWR